MQLKTDALVLKEVKVGDSDKILTLLSAEHGKISAYIKGARSLKSKNLAASGLLSYSSFTILKKPSGNYLSLQASPIESFFGLRSSLERLSLGCYFAELAAFISHEDMESSELLKLILNGLYMLSKKDNKERLIKAAFELRLLSIAGQAPDLVACEACGEFSEDMYLRLREGTMLCGRCKAKAKDLALPVLPSAMQAMRYILYSEPKRIFSFELSMEGEESLRSVVESYLITQLQSGFSTLEFYKSLT